MYLFQMLISTRPVSVTSTFLFQMLIDTRPVSDAYLFQKLVNTTPVSDVCILIPNVDKYKAVRLIHI